jgi:hypothetical protein
MTELSSIFFFFFFLELSARCTGDGGGAAAVRLDNMACSAKKNVD